MSIQTLERAITLIRLLAAAGPEGRRLVDLQEITRLTKPTIHRILSTLRDQGLVEQVEATRRYRLGKELGILGWSALRNFYDVTHLAANDMSAVAAKTGDTCFLMVRSTHDTVCMDRQTGSHPVKAFVVEVGMRRPLGLGATGVAMLAAMDPDQAEQVLETIKGQLKHFPLATEARIRTAVADARRNGYALSDELMVRGVRAVAMCINDPGGSPVAGISVATTTDRMQEHRIPEVIRILKLHTNRIEQRIAAACMLELEGAARVVRTSALTQRASRKSAVRQGPG
ncbi:IclR family transcriptional regulator [Bordetella sp. BOR01]|uniref:IclR family transcriptional regulator n=1 Tax=Bordetella sp. BOR01 TaxID=2854779 RepID=UPI001C476B62|nr:IclR family transcriptional regulator [Bordetella sp. BOR01]MBV7482762.1 IclR family transcriptional regulator [Bordetella sp. BOR01]